MECILFCMCWLDNLLSVVYVNATIEINSMPHMLGASKCIFFCAHPLLEFPANSSLRLCDRYLREVLCVDFGRERNDKGVLESQKLLRTCRSRSKLEHAPL